MKKFTALLICALILCSFMVFSANAETKNLCQTFENEINTLHLCINNQLDVNTSQSFETDSIMTYLDVKIGSDKYNEMGDNGFCLVDADLVESKAKEYFLNVDINALRKTVNPFEDLLADEGFGAYRYSKTAKKYVIQYIGFGAPSRYVVIGYKQKGDVYDVYSAYINPEGDNTIPEGAKLNKDYVEYLGKGYLVNYIVKTTVAYKNNVVKFCAWDYDASLPDMATYITPKTDLSATSSATSSKVSSATSSATSSKTSSTSSEKVNDTTIYAKAEDLSVTGKANLFPRNTVFKAEKITEGEIFTRVKNVLPDDTGRYSVYEITAKIGDETIQPKGKINATFTVPKSFDLDRIVVLYVSPEGNIETVTSKTDYVNGMVTAELKHFSTYVLAEGAPKVQTDGEKGGGAAVIIWIIIGAVTLALASGGVAFWLLYMNYRKASK